MTHLKVSCHSGHTYAQEPRSFIWEGMEHHVSEVVKTWRTPEGLCFLVETGASKRFTLCYNEAQDKWIMQ